MKKVLFFGLIFILLWRIFYYKKKEVSLNEYDLYETNYYETLLNTFDNSEKYYLYFIGNIDYKQTFDLRIIFNIQTKNNKIYHSDTINASTSFIKHVFSIESSIYENWFKKEYVCLLQSFYLRPNERNILSFKLLYDKDKLRVLKAKIIISDTKLHKGNHLEAKNYFFITD